MLPVDIFLQAGRGCDRAAFSGKIRKEETDKADGKEEKSSQESEPEAETIWVDVSGAVNRPGVYELQKEARVFEAVKAAGGFPKRPIPDG